jgi:hypothetical protein
MRKTLEVIERRNVVGITSGPWVGRWREEAGDRFELAHCPPEFTRDE